jgi:hypothetical protein
VIAVTFKHVNERNEILGPSLSKYKPQQSEQKSEKLSENPIT